MKAKRSLHCIALLLICTSQTARSEWHIPKEDVTISCSFERPLPRDPKFLNQILGPKASETGTFDLHLRAGKQAVLVDWDSFPLGWKHRKLLNFRTAGWIKNTNEVEYELYVGDANTLTLWKKLTLNRFTLSGSIDHERVVEESVTCRKSAPKF